MSFERVTGDVGVVGGAEASQHCNAALGTKIRRPILIDGISPCCTASYAKDLLMPSGWAVYR